MATPEENIPDIELESLEALPENHWVLSYVKHRQIPRKFWNEIFYSPNFFEFVKIVFPKELKQLPEDERLVFPLYDENHNLQGVNARALQSSNLRYIVRKFSDDAIKLYGLHRLDKSKKVYCFEGPIDSLFIENSVATCDSDLPRSAKYIPKDQLVLVYDNQYWNKEIRKSIEKTIDAGFNICIFPKSMVEKDVNEFIMNGHSCEEIKTIIDNNTFNGLRAKMELQFR